MVITKQVIFYTKGKDVEWKVFVYNKEASLKDVNKTICTEEDAMSLLSVVQSSTICAGNPDDKFKDISLNKREAYSHQMGADTCIRHNSCQLLLNQMDRCKSCQLTRASLRSFISRKDASSKENRVLASSTVPLSVLTESEMKVRYGNLKKQHTVTLREKETLLKKIAKMQENNKDLNAEMNDTVHQQAVAFSKKNLSPLCTLFMEEQLKANTGPKKSMRWHPFIIRWALGLKSKSTSAYRFLRKSGLIALPS